MGRAPREEWSEDWRAPREDWRAPREDWRAPREEKMCEAESGKKKIEPGLFPGLPNQVPHAPLDN